MNKERTKDVIIDTLNTIEEFEELLDKSNISFYGAGKVARIMLMYSAKANKRISSILVSNKKNNPLKLLGYDVISLDEVEEKTLLNSTVIVCVYETRQKELIEILEKKKVERCYRITDNLINQIEFLNSSFEIELVQGIQEIANRLNLVERNLQNINSLVLWDNTYEKKVVAANWKEYLESDRFPQYYINLLRDLDEESAATVNKILIRQRKYLASDDTVIDLFTPNEQNELKKQRYEFWDEIIKVSDSFYAYKNYFLKRNIFEVSVFYYKHGKEKLKNPERVAGTNILDVGGYVGDSVLVLEDFQPNKIYSFEAIPEHIAEMKDNLELNHIENCVVENTALGDYEGTVLIHCNESGSSIINRKAIEFYEDIEVPITTLDKYVEKKEISNIGLIKVDIEGAEPSFLKGAENTIRNWKPTLLISIYHNGHDFFMLKPMIESWNLGYSFQIFKPINGNISNETLLIAEVIS